MRTLADSRDLIAQSDVFEIGCGADYGLIEKLGTQGIQAFGVDLEPGAPNQDSILTELELKFRAGGLSCYRHYPENITNVWQAAQFLKTALKGKPMAPAIDLYLNKITELQAQAEQMEFRPMCFSDSLVANRVVEGDAREVLNALEDKEYAAVYAENFLHNFEVEDIKDWAELIRSRLKFGGKLVVIQRTKDNVGATIEGVTSAGLIQVSSVPLDLASDPFSLRTATLVESGLAASFHKLVYQK